MAFSKSLNFTIIVSFLLRKMLSKSFFRFSFHFFSNKSHISARFTQNIIFQFNNEKDTTNSHIKKNLIECLLCSNFPVNISIVHKRNCSSFHPGKPMFSYQGCITNRPLVSLRYGCQIWLAPTGARLCRSARHALDHGSIHSGDAEFPLIHQPRRKGWKGSSMAQGSRCRHVR